MRVLIADDDPIWVKLLAKTVEQFEFEAVTVSSGRGVIRKLAASDAPRVVFLDWDMPHGTGPEVCRWIKRAEHRPFTYVVILTGRDSKQDMIEGLEAGADDYLTKPVETSVIKSRLVAARRIIEAIPPADWTKPRIDGYDVEKMIGRGAYATVWDAVHEPTGRRRALKMIRVDLATEQVFGRFAREIKVMRRLTHPNITTVFDAQINHKVAYIAMERIDGQELDRFVRRTEPGPLELIRIIASVCDGLDHAHQHGVIHRDLKPSNIMVTTGQQPKILDFGLCKSMFDAVDDAAESVDGLPIGSPLFMAPEQVRGNHSEIDHRSDIYSLGVTLYMILLRRHPVVESILDRDAAVQALRTHRVRPPSAIRPNFSKPLESIILKALAPDPDDRFVSASELADTLRDFVRSHIA